MYVHLVSAFSYLIVYRNVSMANIMKLNMHSLNHIIARSSCLENQTNYMAALNEVYKFLVAIYD